MSKKNLKPKTNQSPGIVFPPPLMFAIIGLGGWLLAKPYPSLRFEAPLWLQFAGMTIALSGLALELWTLGLFKRANTSALPWRGDDALIAEGPYKISRNPMYAGMLLLVFGLCLGLGLTASLLAIPFGAFIIDRVVIAAEERYLSARFGKPYLDYCAQVRRWL
jgi:protein-S-isoprenylcysteine O-methyltransferase Ste14